MDKNIIYAHGIIDNSMFSSLRKTLNSSWYNNPDNYIINFLTENFNSLWRIFSVYKIPTTSDYLNIIIWLNMLKDRSIMILK